MSSGWLQMLPELWVGALALFLLSLDLWGKLKNHSSFGLGAALGLFPALFIVIWQAANSSSGTFLGGMYRVDGLALLFKGIFLLTAVLVTLMSWEEASALGHGQGEFYLLILTATLGMLFAASAADFIMLFVALELITISFYVMTAYLKTNRNSLEAGLKYLILGSVASGFFLYGTAFVYGATGSTRFGELQEAIRTMQPFPPGLLFGLLLILAAVIFKAAAVPFQLWVPDVYEGAPTPVTAFLSVGSKSAGFIVAFRLLYELFLPAHAHWAPLVAVLAGLTILYGNLGAIPQKNMKRLLGYSSIGHAGYLLIGISAGSSLGATAVNFYLAGYLVTNLCLFLAVCAFSAQGGSDEIESYAGLSRRSPFLAAAIFIALLSLAGVPPLAGFFGKFLLLMSAVREGQLWLAAIGAAAVVISLYYYLMIVKAMYVDLPEDSAPVPVSLPTRLAITGCLFGILLLGIWQAPFIGISFFAAQGLF
ncbi:MAG: NADH-quinone oxidoreductase subunit N [Candidatus Omnitrophica bacterium]|nr:NADH-quinone oxidoreductase subunit N [Candidatus Omnitrophota bacterium]